MSCWRDVSEVGSPDYFGCLEHVNVESAASVRWYCLLTLTTGRYLLVCVAGSRGGQMVVNKGELHVTEKDSAEEEV